MRVLYLIGSILWLSTFRGMAQPAANTRPAGQPLPTRPPTTARPTKPATTAPHRLRYTLEAGSLVASSRQTPFWLRANQYGTVPPRGSFGTVRGSIVRDYAVRPDSTVKRRSRLDWGFGLSAVLNVGHDPTPANPNVLLPDAYLKVRLGRLELYGGNRREVAGLGDTTLTSGFVAWSGNARPFPKIQLHTPDYVPLGFTRKWVALRVGYAHGWLVNAYIRGSYLHHKYLYGRLGRPNGRFRFFAGLNHQVQWGGRASYLVGSPLAVNGQLPTAFSDYVSLVTGRYPGDIQNDRFTGFDGENRIGNHVGSFDLALEWNGRRCNWLLYHQHLYEDASGLSWQNAPDGLTGLRLLNQQTNPVGFRLQRAVVEWLSTTNQSGPVFNQTLRFQGRDNYFNHGQYVYGWSYRGQTLGTPFIIPRSNFTGAVNDYIGGGFFPNNRIVVWYGGLTGAFRRGHLLTGRVSHSRNFGSFNQPYPRPFRQVSMQLTGRWRFAGWPGAQLTTSLALDRGGLLPNTWGSYVGLSKTW